MAPSGFHDEFRLFIPEQGIPMLSTENSLMSTEFPLPPTRITVNRCQEYRKSSVIQNQSIVVVVFIDINGVLGTEHAAEPKSLVRPREG
jgi:hypothetical protein